MAAHAFMFSLDMAGRQASSDMLGELAAQVLGQLGFARDAKAAIVSALQAAVAPVGDSAEMCRVSFHAGKGRLEIEVSAGAGRIWHTSQAIS